jgi:glycosyltransferase involved in cell wall biosynthesis
VSELPVANAPLANALTAISISVVICTRDRPALIRRAIESVAQQDYPHFDVLVVDQSSSDDTQQIVDELMEQYPCVHYLHLNEVGVSRSYNVGISSTNGEILAFTDEDCAVAPNWLEAIGQAFTREPYVQVVFGQVLLPPELLARDGVDGITPMLPFTQRRRMSQRDGFQVFGMGCSFAARRTVCRQIGGFDEILCYGGPLKCSQDFDFEYRVYRSGGTILLEPEVIVYHYGFRSLPQWGSSQKTYAWGDGAFYMKHVRSGDLLATWLLAQRLTLCIGRAIKKHLVMSGTHSNHWVYAAHFIAGMLASFKFGVERQHRLYYMRRHTKVVG